MNESKRRDAHARTHVFETTSRSKWNAVDLFNTLRVFSIPAIWLVHHYAECIE